MLLIWNVNYRMLDIIWKNESLCNDVVILDSIPNVYVFKVNGLSCELPSDESIVDIENIRSVICGMDWPIFSVC
jgi:hypothetical protein